MTISKTLCPECLTKKLNDGKIESTWGVLPQTMCSECKASGKCYGVYVKEESA